MNAFCAIFQLVNPAFFLIVFIGRSLYMWLTQAINPLTLGAGKKGLPHLLELRLFPWLLLWLLAKVWSVLRNSFQPVSWIPIWPKLLSA